MTVRCKCTVVSVTKSLSWDRTKYNYNIKLTPVVSSADAKNENKLFWEATPSGNFEFTTVNEEAALSLKIGKDYYLDFTEAP